MTQRAYASSIVLGICLLLVAALPAAAQPKQVCLYAFSKDMCGTRLFGGDWGIPACVGPGGANCHNLVGDKATFSGPLVTSAGTCGEDVQVPCDEAPDFVGTLIATVDVRTQRHTNCKARGSYDGDFKITDSLTGDSFASGRLTATMGMGTHRDTCTGACNTGECERCHDARIYDEQFNWEIGSEGTLRGEVFEGPYRGCTFTASYQGNFIADGDSRGPQTPNYAWGFCGAMEGVLECEC
jgi:hypothetical protein